MAITDALLTLISFTYLLEEQQLEDLLSNNITVNNTIFLGTVTHPFDPT